MPYTLQNEVDLPVIDISQFHELDFEESNSLQYHPAVATVREACNEWGFFSIVNHGIPVDLLQEVESLVCQLCAMPSEVKEKARTSNPRQSYSVTASSESFCFTNLPYSHSVQEMCDRVWAEEGNPKFCEAIRAYAFCMEDLQHKISKIILASLGLDVKNFYHSDFEECTAYMRITHYSSDGKSTEEEEALFAHTDIGCFTILKQDNESGLQVRSKEGKWLNVKPQRHAFVVNVADCLKAWSNCRYRSSEHRVVYKGWRDRISLPYFVQFPEDKEIWAPAELVDDDHPRRYNPFLVSQFRHDYFNNLETKEEKPTAFVDIYAGI